jgi:hypothetical protein
VSFTAITLCVVFHRVFIVYFVIDPVRKLLDTPPYVLFVACFPGMRKEALATSRSSQDQPRFVPLPHVVKWLTFPIHRLFIGHCEWEIY